MVTIQCFLCSIDNYYYAVYYWDGHRAVEYKGNAAYKRFLDPNAWRIERETKDLFPSAEVLMEKDISVFYNLIGEKKKYESKQKHKSV